MMNFHAFPKFHYLDPRVFFVFGTFLVVFFSSLKKNDPDVQIHEFSTYESIPTLSTMTFGGFLWNLETGTRPICQYHAASSLNKLRSTVSTVLVFL